MICNIVSTMLKRRKMSRSCALRYVVLILNILMIAINLPKFLAKPSAFLFSRRSTVKYVVSSKTLLSMQSRSTLQRHSSTSFSQYFHPIKGGGKIVSPLLFSERFGGDVALRDSDREILRATRNWINRVVVGLSLCPFAEKPIKDGKLSIYVVRGGYDSYPGWNYDGSRSRRKSWKKSSNDASGEDASNKNNPEPLDPIGSKLLTETSRGRPSSLFLIYTQTTSNHSCLIFRNRWGKRLWILMIFMACFKLHLFIPNLCLGALLRMVTVQRTVQIDHPIPCFIF